MIDVPRFELVASKGDRSSRAPTKSARDNAEPGDSQASGPPEG